MNRYLIETPHSAPDCLALVQQVHAMGYLHNFDWGCKSGEHCGWTIVEAEDEEMARLSVPPLVRSRARVVQLIRLEAAPDRRYAQRSHKRKEPGTKMSEPVETIRFSTEEAARIVRQSYGGVVPQGMGVAESLYDPDEIAWLPASVTSYALGLGDPVRYAALRPGESVLDVGSGAGIDSFNAARKVGPAGRVIGLDMTLEMVERARTNQAILGLENVEFREGTMEQIPLPDASVDAIISNGVVNLSTDKGQAFREMYRVLRPGGRLVFSDSVVNGQLPRSVLDSEAAFAG